MCVLDLPHVELSDPTDGISRMHNSWCLSLSSCQDDVFELFASWDNLNPFEVIGCHMVFFGLGESTKFHGSHMSFVRSDRSYLWRSLRDPIVTLWTCQKLTSANFFLVQNLEIALKQNYETEPARILDNYSFNVTLHEYLNNF